MKANHNLVLAGFRAWRTMVNIGMSKNESKSQPEERFFALEYYYGKYRHVKE